MNIQNLSFFFILLVFSAALFAEENLENTENIESGVFEDYTISENITAPAAERENSIYFINSYIYEIDGITRPFALDYKTGIFTGEEITGISGLEKYIQDKMQILLNERLFESVRIEYEAGPVNEEGKYPVDVVFYIKDTWNIIALPYPQYDDNTGFSITLKARDYNFLGIMSPLRLDLGYQFDKDGRNYFTLMLDSDIPFRFLNLNWNFDFDHDLQYRPELDDNSIFYENKTGISVELPFRRTIFTIGFTEYFILNEENQRKYREQYGRLQEGLYMSSQPYISWRIPTGLNYFDIGEVVYTPRFSARFNHELPDWPLADFLKGPFLDFSHSINFGSVDWIGNFRRGASFNIGNSFSYNFYNFRNDIEPLGGSLSISGAGYGIITDFLGFSVRMMYRHWFFNDICDSAGDVLRGIWDEDISANYMFSFNLDIPFRIFKFRPSQWFKNRKNFWRIFDFDFHLGPFIDAALYHYSNAPNNQRIFGLENLLLTAGLEAVVFPERWRSLAFRISYGRNLSIGSKEHSGEFFFGMDFHY